MDEIKENGSAETKSSWPKVVSWLAFVMSITVPVAAIGLSIMSLSSCVDEEQNETKVLCYISVAISVYLILSDLVVSLFAL